MSAPQTRRLSPAPADQTEPARTPQAPCPRGPAAAPHPPRRRTGSAPARPPPRRPFAALPGHRTTRRPLWRPSQHGQPSTPTRPPPDTPTHTLDRLCVGSPQSGLDSSTTDAPCPSPKSRHRPPPTRSCQRSGGDGVFGVCSPSARLPFTSTPAWLTTLFPCSSLVTLSTRGRRVNVNVWVPDLCRSIAPLTPASADPNTQNLPFTFPDTSPERVATCATSKVTVISSTPSRRPPSPFPSRVPACFCADCRSARRSVRNSVSPNPAGSPSR